MGGEENLDEALRLVNLALKELPNHPLVMETRGQIYTAMKRYEEAIPDLESCLLGIGAPDIQLKIHQSLAELERVVGGIEFSFAEPSPIANEEFQSLPPVPTDN